MITHTELFYRILSNFEKINRFLSIVIECYRLSILSNDYAGFNMTEQKVKKDRLIAGYLLSYVRHVLLGKKILLFQIICKQLHLTPFVFPVDFLTTI